MSFEQFTQAILRLHDEAKAHGWDTFIYATDSDMEVLAFQSDDLDEMMSRLAYDKELKLAMMKGCLSEN